MKLNAAQLEPLYTGCVLYNTAQGQLITALSLQIIGELLADAAAAQAVEQYIAQRASRGLRALGVAQSHDQGTTWELVGLISLLDPPREDSAETIKHAQDLGVEVTAPRTCTRVNFLHAPAPAFLHQLVS